MVAIANGQNRPVRHGSGIKILEVPGHIEDTPGPNGAEAKVIRNPAVCLGGALGQGDGADDGPGQGETAQEGHLQNHLVRGVPHLLVHVKGLGVDVTHAFHLSQILEEIPQTGREILEVAVVHGNPHLIQKQGAVRLWPEGGKHIH